MPLEVARAYEAPFQIVLTDVKPVREKDNREQYRRLWWQFAEKRRALSRKLSELPAVFVAVSTTKFLSFSRYDTGERVFGQALKVFTTDRWDLYAVVQSTIHEVWARKYSGALETRLRYSPSDCFENYAFPDGLWQTLNVDLAILGERYHRHRKALMLSLWLGLTDIYNLFHTRDLTPERVAKVSKKSVEEAARGYEGLLELRRLHVALDIAIRDAYSWQNLPLDHDFYEVETLAENDRARYTISPVARKEVLRRLLALNQTRAAEEKAKEKPAKTKRGKKSVPQEDQAAMFVEGA